MKVEYTDFRCKFCGSANIIRYGTFRGIQRWWCKTCQRKFVDNDALPNMKTPVRQIGSALNMYYEGMSLNAIRRHLYQMHNNYPSDSTVYEWVKRFTKKAINNARDYEPDVGDVWVADETVLKIGGEKVWFWDLIDAKTRFLLASHLSTTRTTRDAQRLFEKASIRAGKVPKVIVTDKLQAYLDGIELAFGADTKHIPAKRLTSSPGTQLIERFHGSLKDRTKVMRGLKSRETARLLMNGWLVHYNFFRPHEGLSDRTPAEKAGIMFPYKNWLAIVTKPIVRATIVQPRIPVVKARIPKLKTVRQRRQPSGIYISQARGGGKLLSRRRVRGAKVIKRMRLPVSLSSIRG